MDKNPSSPTKTPHPPPFSPRSGEKGELLTTVVRAPRPAHRERGRGVRASIGDETSPEQKGPHMTDPTKETTVLDTPDVHTEAVTTPPPPIANSQQPIATSLQPPADLTKVRELVLKAHPDVVPDLVACSAVDELIASVEPARTAYQRIADQVRESRSLEGEQSRSQEERPDSSTPRLLASVAGAATHGPCRRRQQRHRSGRPGPHHEDRAGPGRAQTRVNGGCQGVRVSGRTNDPDTLTPRAKRAITVSAANNHREHSEQRRPQPWP